jgi:hypothetical protein
VREGYEVDGAERIAGLAVRIDPADYDRAIEPVGEGRNEESERALRVGTAIDERIYVVRVDAEARDRPRIFAKTGCPSRLLR